VTVSRPPVVSVNLTNRDLGTLGLVSVGVILAGMIVTAIPYKGFDGEAYSPLNHFISELGEIGASHLAWVFNLGIVLGGLGLGTFLLLVSRQLDGRFRSAMTAVSVVAGAGGIAVGIYPMDYPTVHLVASLTFFLSGWITAAIFSVWQLRRQRPGFTRLLVLPAALNVCVSWVFIVVYGGWRPGSGDGRIIDRPDFWSVPALEWASLLTLLLWLACLAIVVRRRPSEE
jgi:hypothetical membrane protein